jgi:hypothetical protein
MPCVTFGNKDTVASKEDFECVQLEVWALSRPNLAGEGEEGDACGSEGAALLGRFT